MVEILSAIREKLPDAPVVKPEHLGTLHTLKDVADFLAGPVAADSGPATTKIPILDMSRCLSSRDRSRRRWKWLPRTTQRYRIPCSSRDSLRRRHVWGGSAEGQRLRRRARQPQLRRLEAARQPVPQFGSERVDRSILQLVDLDPGREPRTCRSRRAGEFWVVADAEPLTDGDSRATEIAGAEAARLGLEGRGSSEAPSGPLSGGPLLAAGFAPGAGSGLNRQAFDRLKLGRRETPPDRRGGAPVLATVARGSTGAFDLAELSPEADPTAGGLAGLAKTARHEWPEVTSRR